MRSVGVFFAKKNTKQVFFAFQKRCFFGVTTAERPLSGTEMDSQAKGASTQIGKTHNKCAVTLHLWSLRQMGDSKCGTQRLP